MWTDRWSRFGLLFVGRWDDGVVIGAGYAFEQATQVRGRGRQVVGSGVKLKVGMGGNGVEG